VARGLGDVCRVLNRGVGGNTTREALARIEKDVLAQKPYAVVVEFGINDAWHARADIRAEEFRENYRRILAMLKEAKVSVIFAIVNHECRNDTPTGEGMVVRTRNARNNGIIRELAAEAGAKTIDMEAGLSDEGLRNQDGIHLSAAGEHRYAEVALAVLGVVFPAPQA
jgi:lysophospholipase L1-like esterase